MPPLVRKPKSPPARRKAATKRPKRKAIKPDPREVLASFVGDNPDVLEFLASQDGQRYAMSMSRGDNAAWVNQLTRLGDATVDRGAAGIPQRRAPLLPGVLEAMYAGGGICHRIVNMVALDATASGWRVDIGDKRDVAKEVDRKLRIHARVADCIRWSRLYGAACLVMVSPTRAAIPDPSLFGILAPVSDAEPMPDGAEIVALQVFSGQEILPSEPDPDPMSPYYGIPTKWRLTSSLGSAGGNVDYSRVCYMPGMMLPNQLRVERQYLDQSVLEVYLDAIRAYVTVSQVAASIIHNVDEATIKIKNLIAKLADPKQGPATIARVQTIGRQRAGTGILPMDTDQEEYERHGLSVTGVGELDAIICRAIASIEGIAQTVWFGDTPSGLNTDNESGRKSRQTFTSGYQTSHVEPFLTRLYSRILHVPEDEISIVFHPLEQPTANELATLDKTLADRDVALVVGGIITERESRNRLKAPETQVQIPIDDDAEFERALLEPDPDPFVDPDAPPKPDEEAADEA